nr:ras-specific guanine nucleotide-releasing factor 1 [Microcebus murinus]
MQKGIRLNDGHVASLGLLARKDGTRKGYLSKRSSDNTKWQTKWFALLQNLLFYFESDSSSRPSGLYLLEGCVCDRAPSPKPALSAKEPLEKQHYFTVNFSHENQKALELRTEDAKDCDEWVAAIAHASYRALATEHEALKQKYLHLLQIVETEKTVAKQLRQQIEDGEIEIERLKGEISSLLKDNERIQSTQTVAPSDEDSDIKKIKKVQSFLRGWLCRRKWKTVIQDYIRSPHADSMRKRNQVVFSMLEAEAEYVQQLHILVNNFLRPLRMAASSKKPPITHDDVSSIFLNSETIMFLHQIFYQGLKARISSWPTLVLADLFDILLPMLNIYQEFVRNHQYSLQILAHCKQNRDFDKLLKHYEAKPDCEERTLETFLTYPMFQVQPRPACRVGGTGKEAQLGAARLGVMHDEVSETENHPRKTWPISAASPSGCPKILLDTSQTFVHIRAHAHTCTHTFRLHALREAQLLLTCPRGLLCGPTCGPSSRPGLCGRENPASPPAQPSSSSSPHAPGPVGLLWAPVPAPGVSLAPARQGRPEGRLSLRPPAGSLIQVPMSEKGKITRGRLGSLSLRKEGERQCFLFSKHLIVCTRGSGGKLHLTKNGVISLIDCTLLEEAESTEEEAKGAGQDVDHLDFKIGVEPKDSPPFTVILVASSRQEKAAWTSDISQCVDNIRCNGLMMNAFEENSKVTVPQMIKSDASLYCDDVDIRFSKTMNSCKVLQIRYASVERLLERLTDLRFLSIDFLNTFLHSYRVFTTAVVVLDKLITIYKKPISAIPARSLELLFASGQNNKLLYGEPPKSPRATRKFSSPPPLSLAKTSSPSRRRKLSLNIPIITGGKALDLAALSCSSNGYAGVYSAMSPFGKAALDTSKLYVSGGFASKIPDEGDAAPEKPEDPAAPGKPSSEVSVREESDTDQNQSDDGDAETSPTKSPTTPKSVRSKNSSGGSPTPGRAGAHRVEAGGVSPARRGGDPREQRPSSRFLLQQRVVMTSPRAGAATAVPCRPALAFAIATARSQRWAVPNKEKYRRMVAGQAQGRGAAVEAAPAVAGDGKRPRLRPRPALGLPPTAPQTLFLQQPWGPPAGLEWAPPQSSGRSLGRPRGPAPRWGGPDGWNTRGRQAWTAPTGSAWCLRYGSEAGVPPCRGRQDQPSSAGSQTGVTHGFFRSRVLCPLCPAPPGFPPDQRNGDKEFVIRRAATNRVLNVLRHWVSKHSQDFETNDELKCKVISFLEEVMHDPELLTQERKAAANIIRTLTQEDPGDSQITLEEIVQMADGVRPEPFESHSALEIAEQLTLLDHLVFRRIPYEEFFGQGWMKLEKNERTPYIMKTTKHFNDISNLIASEIVRNEDVNARASAIEKWVAVADICRCLHNYNAVLQITSSMNRSAIFRLKKTWLKVSKQTKALIDKLQKLVSSEGRFKNLREALKNCDPPCVPYLGMYLTDLAFIEEGTPNYTEDGLVNFSKMRMISHIIREIRQFQQTAYKIEHQAKVTQYLLDQSFVMDEESLYESSLRIEPKLPT